MTKELPLVKWASITGKSPYDEEPDDFTFEHGGYCLRVEQMNNRYWWWAVYFEKEDIDFDYPHARTMEQAMAFAEAGFYSHLISPME